MRKTVFLLLVVGAMLVTAAAFAQGQRGELTRTQRAKQCYQMKGAAQQACACQTCTCQTCGKQECAKCAQTAKTRALSACKPYGAGTYKEQRYLTGRGGNPKALGATVPVYPKSRQWTCTTQGRCPLREKIQQHQASTGACPMQQPR